MSKVFVIVSGIFVPSDNVYSTLYVTVIVFIPAVVVSNADTVIPLAVKSFPSNPFPAHVSFSLPPAKFNAVSPMLYSDFVGSVSSEDLI